MIQRKAVNITVMVYTILYMMVSLTLPLSLLSLDDDLISELTASNNDIELG